MPKVTIDGRTVEVEAGTNLIEAGTQVGVQIPHYCYHPRLTVVGQCRMCLVKVEGMPKLQTACTTQVMKDGMEVMFDHPEVAEAQEGIMEFLLINHPLDCPICDQAGECGLQDYSFKHGQAFSRFQYEEKRTYPGRERIPLGPNVMLNMNRCIQCTRCIRFTEEISGTGELGFFQRGARTEIGVFPGKVLDNDLSANVVDVCPVGALTSSEFRFSERVWYLDKKPSICTGCDVGCNITVEHRKGSIKRLKPRVNTEVNDYWMCDFGRGTYLKWEEGERVEMPMVRVGSGGSVNGGSAQQPANWGQALDAVHKAIKDLSSPDGAAFLASGNASTEEAYMLVELAEANKSKCRLTGVGSGPTRTIPNLAGGISGSDTMPNRRGLELVGLPTQTPNGISSESLLQTEGAMGLGVVVVLDGDLGGAESDPQVVARLRLAKTLVVAASIASPLTKAADIVLPLATAAEKSGTFVNSEHRMQRFEAAFPAPGQAKSGVAILSDLMGRFSRSWKPCDEAAVYDRMAMRISALSGTSFANFPAAGLSLVAPDSGAQEEEE
jgi:NADH-quinone oxidoreductase subunit G